MDLESYLTQVLTRKRSQMSDKAREHAQIRAYRRGYAQAIDEITQAIREFRRLEKEWEEKQINLF